MQNFLVYRPYTCTDNVLKKILEVPWLHVQGLKCRMADSHALSNGNDKGLRSGPLFTYVMSHAIWSLSLLFVVIHDGILLGKLPPPLPLSAYTCNKWKTTFCFTLGGATYILLLQPIYTIALLFFVAEPAPQLGLPLNSSDIQYFWDNHYFSIKKLLT